MTVLIDEYRPLLSRGNKARYCNRAGLLAVSTTFIEVSFKHCLSLLASSKSRHI
jgi:hypothetical protein